jgi:hypothetical protein
MQTREKECCEVGVVMILHPRGFKSENPQGDNALLCKTENVGGARDQKDARKVCNLERRVLWSSRCDDPAIGGRETRESRDVSRRSFGEKVSLELEA